MDADGFLEALEREGIEVFSIRDAARIIRKPPTYVRLYLSRLARRKKILRIERGKYCLKSTDILVVASNLVQPSYVSFISALAYHKLTLQIPVRMQVAVARQKKAVTFKGMEIEFVKLKRRAMFGFRRYGDAFVAEPEKAIVDALYVPERLLISEVHFALKQGGIDVGRLCEYAKTLGSSIVKRRLGLLFEKAGIRASGLGLPRKSTRYVLLNPFLKAKGEKNGKWMIQVNEVLE